MFERKPGWHNKPAEWGAYGMILPGAEKYAGRFISNLRRLSRGKVVGVVRNGADPSATLNWHDIEPRNQAAYDLLNGTTEDQLPLDLKPVPVQPVPVQTYQFDVAVVDPISDPRVKALVDKARALFDVLKDGIPEYQAIDDEVLDLGIALEEFAMWKPEVDKEAWCGDANVLVKGLGNTHALIEREGRDGFVEISKLSRPRVVPADYKLAV